MKVRTILFGALVILSLYVTVEAQFQPHSVDLTWKPGVGSNPTAYKVYRSAVSGSNYLRIATVTTASYTDVDQSVLKTGTTWFYVVTAMEGKAESTNSNEVRITVPVDVPIPVSAPTDLIGAPH